MTDNRKIGEAIAQLRQAENMTQQTLAACLNVSHQAVSKWENGSALPDVLTLVEMSKLFGVTLEQLLSGDVSNRLEKLNAEEPIRLHLDTERPFTEKVERAVEKAEADLADVEADIEAAMADIEADIEAGIEADQAEADAKAESDGAEEPDAEPAGDTAPMDANRIFQMAPFMSRTGLGQLIKKSNCKWTPAQVARLAPFVSSECLEGLISECESDISWDTLRRVAPFMKKEAVDTLTMAIAEGKKYVRPAYHAVKKTVNEAGKALNEAMRKLAETGKKPEGKAEPQPAPVDPRAAVRARIFERALAEEKFDWIGEHLGQLDDEALKARIAERAKELGMTEWLKEHAEALCGEITADMAMLEGDWDAVAAKLADADDAVLAVVAETAAAERRWDWLEEHLDALLESDGAVGAIIKAAADSDNLDWLARNLSRLEPDSVEAKGLLEKIVSAENWDWLEANCDRINLDDLVGEELLLSLYKAGKAELALNLMEEYADDLRPAALIKEALSAGDVEFAQKVFSCANLENDAAFVAALAKDGCLEALSGFGEFFDDEALTALLAVAEEEGNWNVINALYDLVN